MRPSDAAVRVRWAVRGAAGTVLLVAAALSTAPVPALPDEPGAKTLGRSVLPPLPGPPVETTAPHAAPSGPLSGPFSGATSRPEPTVSAPPDSSKAPEAAAEAGTAAEPASATGQLAAARRDAIAAATQVQRLERGLAAIRHELDLLERDADASRRGLAESRAEQESLLGTALHFARNLSRDGGAADAPLIERLRAEALMREADPALRAELHALTSELARLDALQKRIAAKKTEEAAAEQALAAERELLAAAVAHREALLRDMSPRQGIDAALRVADTEREAKSLSELIKRVDAAEERSGTQRERGRTGKSRNKPPPLSDDPTRPDDLRSLAQESGLAEGEPAPSGGQQQGTAPDTAPPHPPLVPPVVGTVVGRAVGRDGEPGAAAPSGGLSFQVIPGAAVVAPFDGKIVYAGPFRDLDRVLIIRHDRRYYSVLAGLGRVDVKPGDWVLAGEPVGAMPDRQPDRSGAEAPGADENGPGRTLYYELRRDGRPVNPQPWLARVEGGHDERNGEQKVSQ